MTADRWRKTCAIAILGSAPWLLPARPAFSIDVLHLKEGDPVKCEILDITDQMVRIKVSIKVPGGDAFSTKIVPVAEVALIDFGPLPGETLLLESATVDDLGELEALWNGSRANLHRPNSSAGEIGLLFAAMLLESGKAGAAGRALDVYSRIEKGDWDERRRPRARQGRLRTLLALGRIDDAVKEATEIAMGTEDRGILADAKHILAEADFDKLKKLVEENPRWEEDDEVRPERNALYHDVIDRFLHPYLFHGSDEEAAARGLWSAIEVHLLSGEEEEARRRAGDLVALYPGSSFAARARGISVDKEGGGPLQETTNEK